MSIVYIRERGYFSLVRMFKKDINNVEVKVDVQTWAHGFRKKKIDNKCVVSSNSCFHPLLSFVDSPQWLPSPLLLG